MSRDLVTDDGKWCPVAINVTTALYERLVVATQGDSFPPRTGTAERIRGLVDRAVSAALDELDQQKREHLGAPTDR